MLRDPYAVAQSNLPCRYRQDSLLAPGGRKGRPDKRRLSRHERFSNFNSRRICDPTLGRILAPSRFAEQAGFGGCHRLRRLLFEVRGPTRKLRSSSGLEARPWAARLLRPPGFRLTATPGAGSVAWGVSAFTLTLERSCPWLASELFSRVLHRAAHSVS